MENSNYNNKDKYKRPGVIEDKVFRRGNDENEKDPAAIDGPYEGVQSARGLKQTPAATAVSEVPSQCRILITKEASHSLDEMAAKVGAGFEGGKIGRAQISSWVLQVFAERISTADIEEIRLTYFDRIAYLESLLKRAKETGVAPAELNALFPDRRESATGKKKCRRENSALETSP